MKPTEEGTRLDLDFDKLNALAERGRHVVPVVLQDADSKEVLFVAYANEEALRETLKTRRAVLWSTSRDKLWRKGDGSGDVLDLIDVRVNCEQNSLVYRVRPRTGGVCHTRDETGRARPNCFYRRLEDAANLTFL
ncbi:MAG: phosphoribosyl-AMP cyclohydrolase [Myxococcota bacterium]